MNESPDAPFRLLVVLSGSSQTGGGYHQSVTSLRSVIRTAPPNVAVSVLDVSGSFSSELLRLRSAGQIDEGQVMALPKEFGALKDRVVSSKRGIYRFARTLLRLSGRRVGMSHTARFIDQTKSDLVYFLSPSPVARELQVKPYIWTTWDVCHLDSPEFPEVRTSHKFEDREEFFSVSLRKAAAVVVDSEQLIQRVCDGFGVNEKKFVLIPFSPQATLLDEAQLLAPSHRLQPLPQPYVFYPAQLWTHKNHIRIAQAIAALKSEGQIVHAVFAGKDHGAGNRLRAKIKSLGVADQVHFLGYVDDAQMQALYQNSQALVMASYFGPTNIPPLEAMQLGVPVVASSIHRSQLESGALYFDPDSHVELTIMLKKVQDPRTRARLIHNGAERLRDLEEARRVGEAELTDRIFRLSQRIL